MATTIAKVSIKQFRKNLDAIRNLVSVSDPVPSICLAVKANAYGHGLVEMSESAVAAGVERLAVANAREAALLRQAMVSVPLLLLSLPGKDDVEPLIQNDVTCMVADEFLIGRFSAVARSIGRATTLHLSIDTGMGRIGCRPEAAVSLAARIEEDRYLRLEGLSTHFACADTSVGTSPDFTELQIERFDGCVSAVSDSSGRPPIIHAANSAALLAYPSAWYDMVRPGIVAYGYPPMSNSGIEVKPVMELASRVVFLKRVARGTPISYGSTYATSKSTVIATVAIGYGDGYPRQLSNKASAVVRGRRYPIVGRVCMDQLMLDLGETSPVELYDEVTLMGPGPNAPDAAELADLAGTISYEITCGVGARVPRHYLR